MLRDDLCGDLGMDEAVLDELGGQVDCTVPAPGYQARQLPVHVVLIRNIRFSISKVEQKAQKDGLKTAEKRKGPPPPTPPEVCIQHSKNISSSQPV